MATQQPLHPVLVARVGDDARKELIGSGSAIGALLVLTARHVVLEADIMSLQVRAASGGGFITVEKVDFPEQDTDVALLWLSRPIREEVDPLACLEACELEAGKTWEAEGFPRVRDDIKNVKSKPITGSTNRYESTKPFMELNSAFPPGDWRGMSGAGVWFAGRLVGVLHAVEKGWNEKRLQAVPLTQFLPWLQERIGTPDASRELQKDVEDLIRRLTDALKQQELLVFKFAQQFRVDSNSEAVAVQLVRSSVDTLLEAFEEVDADDSVLGGWSEEPRIALRKILVSLLPYMMDWSRTVAEGRERVKTGYNIHQLNFTTETIAEAILSGVYQRDCYYHQRSQSKALVGVGMMRLPEGLSAPFLKTSKTVAGLVAKKLAPTLDLDPLGEGLEGAVEARLSYYATTKRKKRRLFRQMVVIDVQLREQGLTSPDELWMSLERAISRELPSLQLVRLRGAPTTRRVEEGRVVRIEEILINPETRGSRADVV